MSHSDPSRPHKVMFICEACYSQGVRVPCIHNKDFAPDASIDNTSMVGEIAAQTKRSRCEEETTSSDSDGVRMRLLPRYTDGRDDQLLAKTTNAIRLYGAGLERCTQVLRSAVRQAMGEPDGAEDALELVRECVAELVSRNKISADHASKCNTVAELVVNYKNDELTHKQFREQFMARVCENEQEARARLNARRVANYNAELTAKFENGEMSEEEYYERLFASLDNWKREFG